MFSQKRRLNETRSNHSVVFCYRNVSLRNVRHRVHVRSLEKILLSAVLIMGCPVQAQESSSPQQAPSATIQTFPEEIEKNRAAPCVEPAPPVHREDYPGKFRRVGGLFARKLECKPSPRFSVQVSTQSRRIVHMVDPYGFALQFSRLDFRRIS